MLRIKTEERRLNTEDMKSFEPSNLRSPISNLEMKGVR